MDKLDKIQEALEFLERECQLFENSSSRTVEKVAKEALAELKEFREMFNVLQNELEMSASREESRGRYGIARAAINVIKEEA